MRRCRLGLLDSEEDGGPRSCLSQARSSGFDFVILPVLGSPGDDATPEELWARSDLTLSANEWSRLVVGTFDLQSEVLPQLAWATHLNLSAVLSSSVLSSSLSNDASIFRAINETLTQPRRASSWQLWVRCSANVDWEHWHALRSLCDYSPALVVALDLSEELPAPEKIRRWRGEPLKAVILSTSNFLKNDAGFPVLPKPYQTLLLSLAPLLESQNGDEYHAHFLVSDNKNDVSGCAQYLRHLLETRRTERERIEAPYRDYLQSPLQPLADDLDSQTYEVFEQDPVKYAKYQEALEKFFMKNNSDFYHVAVVGAGRGPLVARTLIAADKVKVGVRVVALEKNPHAVRTLKAFAANDANWAGRVTVIQGNARTYVPLTKKFDAIVSELLGSFGDNELSPECLDKVVNRTWLREGGISIPERYTSFAQPISAATLWRDARRAATIGAPPGPPPALISPGAPPPARGLETPFVVKLHSHAPLAPALPCFHFQHILDSPLEDKNRHIRLEFKAPLDIDVVVHGLAGYFDALLYDDVTISIHPETFSDGMFSWFPLFIPFLAPVNLRSGDRLLVDLWRRSDATRVWYEWAVLSPVIMPIQNPSGRSCAMYL